MSFPPSAGHRALRLGRVSIPGQIYLLTTVTHERRCLFADPVRARVVCRMIHASHHWADAELLAWVLMPDHWHGLLQLGEESLGRAVHRFKAGVSRALHGACGFEGRVWERGFHDHALRREEGVEAAANYLIANPVRAGLVDHVLDYPYWNTAWPSELQEPARGRCSCSDASWRPKARTSPASGLRHREP